MPAAPLRARSVLSQVEETHRRNGYLPSESAVGVGIGVDLSQSPLLRSVQAQAPNVRTYRQSVTTSRPLYYCQICSKSPD